MGAIKEISFYVAIAALFSSGGYIAFKSGIIDGILSNYATIAGTIGAPTANLILVVIMFMIVGSIIGILRD